MVLKVHALIIDPQNGFMDSPGNTELPVPGAVADMRRAAMMIRRTASRINGIHVTMDTHHPVDLGHQVMWHDANGNPPPPFTAITSADISSGIWTPRYAQAKPPALGGRTIKDYFIWYADQLEQAGEYLLMIWPTHCLLGSSGYAIQSDLFDAITQWELNTFSTINWVAKGLNPWTEHYGALQAEVPMPNDPSTTLNSSLLEMLRVADIIVVFGQALSHCVKRTVTQVADHIGDTHIPKFHIVTDCSSPVPKVGDGPDFPAIANDWLREMEARGMTLTNSDSFLA